MDFLSDLMGGGKRQDEYRDFADRYDRGAPYDRISEEETVDRYREVAPNLSDEDYQAAAREAFSRMSPEERMQFARELSGYARDQGHGDFIDRNHDGKDDRFQDPDYLAQTMTRMHHQQPNMTGNLLGGLMGAGAGGGGGGLGGMLSGGQESRSGGAGGMMGSPVAKAAMAGIAAMAVRRMMNRGR
ncbi:Hypothetical Protein RradSPS_1890 [Rubrobacter radiotolerans]|uniref:Uncharacterized protein n=1 Tax=Rubrobacter radiotolerans TaxID=42256 RepID=A0A023X4B1_RUBRA